MLSLSRSSALQLCASEVVLQGAGASSSCSWRAAVPQATRCFSAAGASENDTKETSKTPAGERYGTRLLKQNPKLLQRMRAILGYYDLPTVQGKPPVVDKVTISTLQTMEYLPGVDPEFKKQLTEYRLYALNREVHPLLTKARQFAASGSANQQKVDIGDMDFSRLAK